MALMIPPDYPAQYNNTRTVPGEPLEVWPRDVADLLSNGWTPVHSVETKEPEQEPTELDDDSYISTI